MCLCSLSFFLIWAPLFHPRLQNPIQKLIVENKMLALELLWPVFPHPIFSSKEIIYVLLVILFLLCCMRTLLCRGQNPEDLIIETRTMEVLDILSICICLKRWSVLDSYSFPHGHGKFRRMNIALPIIPGTKAP